MIFSPIQIANLNVSNRIAVAPMCQYSSVDGAMTDWHTQHLMQLGYSGAGLIMIEATAVERIGRITHHCVGLYNDFCERSIKKTLEKKKIIHMLIDNYVLDNKSYSSLPENLKIDNLFHNHHYFSNNHKN